MPSFRHEPIGRHEAFVPFSRDHYTGLVQAQHLIKASQTDEVARRKAVAEFVDAYDREIAEHFDDEERLLLDSMTEEDARTLLAQHHQLRRDAERIRAMRRSIDPSPDLLVEVGTRLNDHIRWEERELFNRMQKQLDKQQIMKLQEQTAQLEATRPRNAFKPGSQKESAE